MRPHRRLRALARGFTLIELMVVVVIIAIMATLSVPLFVQRMRERAVTQAAMTMGDLFRGARTRAMARGAAIMVTTQNDGAITVFEGVEGQVAAVAAGRASCGNLPVRGCTTNNWGNILPLPNIGNARQVGGITASTDFTTNVTLGAAPVSPVHICFSPGGRTFVNQAGVWTPAAWTPLTDVLTISVTSSGGRARNVVVLPNGTARLAL